MSHCKKCDLIYSSDCFASAADHELIHKKRIEILKFKMYKNENIIQYKGHARVIFINKQSHYPLVQKGSKL